MQNPDPAAPTPPVPTAGTPDSGAPLRIVSEVAWLAPLAAVLSLLFVRQIRSADFWWHLATGRWIVDNDAVPRTDPFSFTAHGQPWEYVNWPVDWLLFRAWEAAGPAGVIGLRLVCVVTVLTVLGLVARQLAGRRDVVALLVVATAIVVQPRYTLDRPFLFGAVLLVFTLWTAARWWRHGGWSILAAVGLTAVWLPVHGSAIVGVACSCGAAASAALFRRERRWLLPAGVAAVASLVLLGATDAGRDIVSVVLLLGDPGQVTALTQEWQRPTFSDPSHRLALSLLVAGVVTAVVRFRRDPLLAGAALLGAYLGMQHIRGLTEGVVMAVPMAAVGLTALGSRLERAGVHLLARVAAPALVLLAVAAHFAGAPRPIAGVRGIGVDARRIPADSVEVLRELPTGRTMNDMDIGGYLIWARVPGGVFVDGRSLAVYTPEQFDRLVVSTLTDEASINAVADEWAVRYAVASHVSVMGRLLMRAESWVPVYHGASTSVFARRSDAPALRRAGFGLFDELRYDLDRAWMDAWYGRVLSNAAATDALVAQLASGLRSVPRSAVAIEVVRYLEGVRPELLARVEAAVADSESGHAAPPDSGTRDGSGGGSGGPAN